MTDGFKPRVLGGFPVGPDGRVHTTFTHNPSSLRLSSVGPNLQNIPRGSGSDYAKWVKEVFVAAPGHLFWERDFSAIEAVLVGYFAGAPNYIRFAKMGVHAYLASHIVGRPIDLKWADADIKAYIKALKKEEPVAYDTAKRIVHGSNYMMTAVKMSYEYPETFPTPKKARELQGLYFDLFPEISAWHRELAIRVDGTKRKRPDDGEVVDPWTLGIAYVQNPFGYIHRFYNVLDWTLLEAEDNGGVREWVWSFGDDAKRLVSFLPQSTAAAIIKRAGKRLWYDYPDVGRTMRLWIHDSILGEVSEAEVENALDVSQRVMEEPIPQLPLDPAWGMGEYLSIGTEAKVGPVWGSMK